ncbi:MAG: type IV secretion system protein [Acidipropionibacterium jensenii]|uniref:type IV secretion system protein n=1 Tax=Acidipropionibacterium jensenii TaxID=1749 RepID=UPI00264815BA|nr:type IV secretion system protein [Acidipropionibacterium jensenii]MDN6513846.1 type IV secretion system protein [Acidipropionibacterium jensenii]
MRDFLKTLLDDVAAGPNSGAVPMLLRLDSFVDQKAINHATAGWQAALHAMQSGIVRPTATIILAILFVIELGAISRRVEGDSELGFQMVAMTFLKFAICKVVFDQLGTILLAITATATSWSLKASESMSSVTRGASLNVDQFLNTVDSQNFLVKGLAAVLIMLGWLIAKIPIFAMIALLITRFIKLQLFSVAAPLPMSFMAHRETSNIAVGFLKNYAAVALQLFFMTLVIPLFAILSSFILSAVQGSRNFSFLLQLVGGLILVGLVCFGLVRLVNEVSKEILGS